MLAIFSGTLEEVGAHFSLPLLEMRVPAGFPSPADAYLEKSLNLHEHLVQHPQATFLMRVEGHSMIRAGIHDGDLIVIDRALEPCHGRIVVAVVDNDFMVKRLLYESGRCLLRSENERFKDVVVGEDSSNQVWGVVTNVIHKV